MTATATAEPGKSLDLTEVFRLLGLAALSARLVQAWVFWGGASRRLIYDIKPVAGIEHAVKMDPNSAGFVANKLPHAMPGSVIPHIINWSLLHPGFLLVMVWIWTLTELVVGISLFFGFATRAMATAGLGLNFVLMILFGWMGSTCVDEWTMSACGFAMCAVLMVTGSGALSIDGFLARRSPGLAQSRVFRWFFSGPIDPGATRAWSVFLAFASIIFTVGFYMYYHGAVFSPLSSRTSFHHHHVATSNFRVDQAGDLAFNAYVNAGPDTGKAHIIDIKVLDSEGNTVANWNASTLAALPAKMFTNTYTGKWGAKITPAALGIGGTTGARATIRLPGFTRTTGKYQFVMKTIDGKSWTTSFSLGG